MGLGYEITILSCLVHELGALIEVIVISTLLSIHHTLYTQVQ